MNVAPLFSFARARCLTPNGHFQRQDESTWTAATARNAVVLSNRAAANHDADRFADDGTEDFTAARAFGAAFSLAARRRGGSRGCGSRHNAGHSRYVSGHFGRRNWRLHDLRGRFGRRRRLLERYFAYGRRIMDATRGAGALGSRRRQLLLRRDEARRLIILHAGSQLDAGRLRGAQVAQELIARNLTSTAARCCDEGDSVNER